MYSLYHNNDELFKGREAENLFTKAYYQRDFFLQRRSGRPWRPGGRKRVAPAAGRARTPTQRDAMVHGVTH